MRRATDRRRGRLFGLLLVALCLVADSSPAAEPPPACPTRGGQPAAGGEQPTPGLSQAIAPFGVAVDAEGHVFVADTWNHRIQKFDSNGGFLTEWGMDGFLGPQMELPPLERLFMFMNSDNALPYNAMFEIASGPAYAVSIEGSEHFNYSDFSIMSPLYKMTGLLGPIEGYRMLEITEAYVLAFFDKYLKGQAAPLLDAPADEYPEVEFRKRNEPPVSLR